METIPYYLDITSMESVTPVAPFEIYVGTENSVDSDITLHRHSFFELIYTIEGVGVQEISGVEYPVQPGTFTLISPYDVHALRSDSSGGVVQKRVAFDTSLLLKNLDDVETRLELTESAQTLLPSFVCAAHERTLVECLFDELEKEADHKVFGTELSPSLALQTFVLFMRTQKDHAQPSSREKACSIWDAYRFIYLKAGQQISAESVAEATGWQVEELKKGLYGALDMSFTDVLNEIRARNAASLLLTFPDMTVGAIAENAGFQSNATFFRAFDQTYDMTPNAYRHRFLFRSLPVLEKRIPNALYGNVVLYMYQHYQEDLKGPWLARHFEVSEQQLSEEFGMYLGMSFGSFLSLLRVKKAAALLRATKQPINLIAEKVGFATVRTFARAFKKFMSTTPTAYRNALK